MSAMDLERIERIRELIPRCQQPFSTHTVCELIGGWTKPNDYIVRHALNWLVRHGELEQHYVKKGRRRNAIQFTTTEAFGERKARPEQVHEAMARLDAALARWKRAPNMLPASVQMALKDIYA
jgi:hypothetical protein